MTETKASATKGVVRAAALIENPAWDYVKSVPNDSRWGEEEDTRFSPTTSEIKRGGISNFVGHRSRVTALWAWAIPNPSALDFVAEQADGRPIVEMGAGNGYWAWCLTQMGLEVTAFDAAPWGHDDSWFGSQHGRMVIEWSKAHDIPVEEYHKEYHPVMAGSVEVLPHISKAIGDHVLFLCWPTFDSSFAYDAVKAYQGDTVIYIGEGNGGCNADWKFFALMEGEDNWRLSAGDPVPADKPDQEWERVAEHSIIQWSGIHDYITVYTRRLNE